MVVFFFEFLTPSTLGGHNFFNFILFLTIFSVLDVLIIGVQVLFKCQKQWSPPFGFGLPWAFKCYNCNSIATQFAIKEQLKVLTHMFCLRFPCYKLYKKSFFFYIFTLKYKCHFGMSLKKHSLKAKHINFFKKNSWLFFSSLHLVFSYLLTYLGK